jgi:mutual gliding-motility protein MglA
MSSINLHTREINIKVVYYGPGLGGKTTSLQHIHRALKPELRGQLVSLATGIDRTLYFDFLPVKLPTVKGFTIRMSLYTVPGQVHYNATRKLVLQGCDGVVFVADSQEARRQANIESLQNLEDNLRGHGMNPESVPTIIQFNKRDIPHVMPVSQMEADLNKRKLRRFDTCALSGLGVFEALRTITKLVLADLKRKGIYQGAKGEKAEKPERAERGKEKEPDRAPVVSPSVEEGLVLSLETPSETEIKLEGEEPAKVPSRGLTFSGLWQSGTAREQILALEGDIERGDNTAAVKRAEGLLREYVGEGEDKDAAAAESLLMIGVHGAHYVRFRNAIAKSDATREDALFCLFFLTDIELRMQSSGMRVVE